MWSARKESTPNSTIFGRFPCVGIVVTVPPRRVPASLGTPQSLLAEGAASSSAARLELFAVAGEGADRGERSGGGNQERSGSRELTETAEPDRLCRCRCGHRD